MMRLAAFAGATLLCAAACTDDRQKELIPTAPPPPVASKASASPAARTTVCLSYVTQRAVLKARLEQSPEDSALRKKAVSYDRMIADACN